MSKYDCCQRNSDWHEVREKGNSRVREADQVLFIKIFVPIIFGQAGSHLANQQSTNNEYNQSKFIDRQCVAISTQK